MTERLPFELLAESTDSRARATRFETLHGTVETPIFMPVGTVATVRAQHPDQLKRINARVLLANTYHLLLRPGVEVFERFGGIHRFMNWDRAVLTDSGGFQIFKLENSREISEEGARFRSYIDGDLIMLSPEKSIAVQKAIGSDIMMVLDQCIPSTCDRILAEEALERTTRWAKRSFEARGDSRQSLFGIIQGARFEDLRTRSAREITEIPFDGFAIGGLAVGEERPVREDMIEHTTALMPRLKPRYLMGVGTPIDLLEAVHRGVDMFDCILPTAFAQQGVAFTSRGKVDLRRGVYRLSQDSLDSQCSCETCRSYSLAYLHHLIRSKEVLGWQLVGAHNLQFYFDLMANIRTAIRDDSFARFYRETKPVLEAVDPEFPIRAPRRRQPKVRAPLELGDYRLFEREPGQFSVQQKSSGEVMHSVSDPFEEANRLYVGQASLLERMKATSSGNEPLVIWDVGLGAGTNAMAWIRALEAIPATEFRRPVKLISFENDLNSFLLALHHPHRFPYLKHRAPFDLRDRSAYRSVDRHLEWTLIQGDFSKTFGDVPRPSIVLYDPFSFKVDHALWSVEFFTRLSRHLEQHDTALFTYSNSTGVRERLLAAGFYVLKGAATPPKNETTIAATESALKWFDSGKLLGSEWLVRYGRSDARTEALRLAVESHRQFQSVRVSE